MHRILAPIVLALMVAECTSRGAARLPLEKIKLPAGFSISVYAPNVPDARSMTMAPDGTLFVGNREKGHVYAIPPTSQNAASGGSAAANATLVTIASDLRMPNGVAFRDGALYVAEVNRILRYDNVLDAVKQSTRGRTSIKPVVVYDKLPSDTHHGWKYLVFGPDGLLYFQVGAPCNICDPKDPYASILRMKPDGTAFETFARGVRNTVGMTWDPETKELWFTDNGRDYLGDNAPPDELNHAPKPGLHFGYPYCHGGTISDPEYGRDHPCSNYTPPAQALGPHVAALGLKFYTGSMFPAQYHHKIFIAEHGSWNRSTPIGYRISLVTVEANKAVKYETFAEGWLQGGSAWGRPVDILEMPDGSLLVSDDEAGAIYRISYKE
jgi:glucose/arabinose dehydrogenase